MICIDVVKVKSKGRYLVHLINVHLTILIGIVVLEDIFKHYLVSDMYEFLILNLGIAESEACHIFSSVPYRLQIHLFRHHNSALGTCQRACAILVYSTAVTGYRGYVVAVAEAQLHSDFLYTFKEIQRVEYFPIAVHVLIGIGCQASAVGFIKAILVRMVGCIYKTELPPRHCSIGLITFLWIIIHITGKNIAILGSQVKIGIAFAQFMIIIVVFYPPFEVRGNVGIGLVCIQYICEYAGTINIIIAIPLCIVFGVIVVVICRIGHSCRTVGYTITQPLVTGFECDTGRYLVAFHCTHLAPVERIAAEIIFRSLVIGDCSL